MSLMQNGGDGQMTPLLRLSAGAVAGIIGMSATYPLDMVRGRLTIQVTPTLLRTLSDTSCTMRGRAVWLCGRSGFARVLSRMRPPSAVTMRRHRPDFRPFLDRLCSWFWTSSSN